MIQKTNQIALRLQWLCDYKPNQIFWTFEPGPRPGSKVQTSDPTWMCCEILKDEQEEKEDKERGKM